MLSDFWAQKFIPVRLICPEMYGTALTYVEIHMNEGMNACACVCVSVSPFFVPSMTSHLVSVGLFLL